MTLPHCAKFFVLAFLCCAIPVAAQTFVPKTIQFNGDPDYTNEELLAASGLTLGESLTQAKINDGTKLLLNTGLFEDIRFAYNDQLLAFQLTPAENLHPIRLENFPPGFQDGLDGRLRAHLPLYRGKIPPSGGMLNEVTDELQNELAAMKIAAAVSPALYTDTQQGKITAISFSITDPDILVGEIRLGVFSATMADKVHAIAAKLTGSAYSSESSEQKLENAFVSLYRAQGYLEAKVHATAKPMVIDKKGVHIPFAIVIEEGPQYTLAGVQLAPDVIVPQGIFDKQLGLRVGDVVSPDKLRPSWEFLAREYHSKGLMRAAVIPTPNFDRAQGKVHYTVAVTPGPVYTVGRLTVESAGESLSRAIASALNLSPGAVFNESELLGMTATHTVSPEVEQFFATESLSYKLNLHDDVHTVDIDILPEKKH
jgi:outer membrane protein insertion porin family